MDNDNTKQKYALVQPYALDPRSNKPKSKQTNTYNATVYSLKTAVYDLLRLFFVLSSTVLYFQQTPKKSPLITKSGEK